MANTGHAHTIDVEDDDHGHGGTGKYIVVFLALCVLTGASFFTYSSYWPFSDIAARTFMLAVSSVKALLVILFFMHLLWEANWKYVLTIPAALMSLFLGCMLIPDVGRRTVRYSEERWTYAAEPIAHEADHGSSEGHSSGESSEQHNGESPAAH